MTLYGHQNLKLFSRKSLKELKIFHCYCAVKLIVAAMNIKFQGCWEVVAFILSAMLFHTLVTTSWIEKIWWNCDDCGNDQDKYPKSTPFTYVLAIHICVLEIVISEKLRQAISYSHISTRDIYFVACLESLPSIEMIPVYIQPRLIIYIYRCGHEN